MEDQKRDYFLKKLLDEKTSIEKQLALSDDFGLSESMTESIGELSSYDNHPADIGTEMFERGKDIALEESKENTLKLINEALEKVEQGTFGRCEKCNNEISIERLEALPYAKYCLEHQPNRQISTTRPIEEEYLNPPFHNTDFNDEDSDKNLDDLFIETDESDGYVEELEGFIITDIYGNPSENQVDFVKNKAYEEYMRKHDKRP